MATVQRDPTWRQSTPPARTRDRRTRLALLNLETRALPSVALADDSFMGPRLDRMPSVLHAIAPSPAASQLDYDPASLGVQPVVAPLLTPLPQGVPDAGLGFTGDFYPAEPAFDAAGNALVGTKSRYNDDLLRLYGAWRQYDANWDAVPFQASELLQVDDQGNVEINVTARDVAALRPALEATGFHTLYALPDQHLLEGYIPIAALPQLDALNTQGLMGVDATYRPQTAVGLVTSQADWVHQADRLRSQTFASGVRVGVLSDSYATRVNPITTAAQDIANGDLPAGGVTVLQEGPAAATDEGRGMLQLVHDVAPGSSLAFATAFVGGEAGFAANIRRLADPADGNCRVIVDDVNYFDEPLYQDGLVAQAVSDVVGNRRTTYCSSAGNNASQSYESPRWLTNSDTIAGRTGNYYDFDTSGNIDSTLGVTIATGQEVKLELQWDQPFFTTSGVTSDIDLYLVRTDTGATVATSEDVNPSNQKPKEFIDYTNSTGQTGFAIAVRLYSGTAANRIKIVNYGNGSFISFNEYTADSGKPTITPHAGTNFALGVGAVPYFDHANPESFTSRGPLTTYFDAAGNRLTTPVVSSNPLIAAVDGTNTSFFGGDADNDTFPNFFGTSAAAPHAAAVAALLLSYESTFDAYTVYPRLEYTADANVGTPGNDPFTGFGLIDAYRGIVGFARQANQVNVAEGFESGYLGQTWDTYTNGAGRVQVRNNAVPASGSFHLTLDTEYGQNPLTSNTNIFSLDEAVLHVPAAGANNLVLSFKSREWNDDDDAMPASFTGHGNYDGVAFSVDGFNWYRLVSLTGTASTNSYQTFFYDLNAAAAAAGIALSADTQIKFQRYGNDQINPGSNSYDGIGFDDVTVSRFGDLTGGVQINDLNGNGSIDAGEPVLPGWRPYFDIDNNGRFDRGNAATFTNTTPGAILDNSTLNSTVAVVGLAGEITDIDVTLDITHTYTGDLTIFLISPGGTSVQLFNRNGGLGNDLSATFDDAAATPIANGFGTYGSFRYRPTAALAGFNSLSGPLVNGNWTLRVIDNANGDIGTLNSWSMTVATAPTFESTTLVAIPEYVSTGTAYTFSGPSTTTSSLAVSGLSGPIDHMRVVLTIAHTFDGDLTVFLNSPTGVRVQLLNRNGGGGDNFANTVFDDFATTPIASGTAPFAGNFKPTQPLGYFGGLSGFQVNGTWTLEIHDNAGGDVGTLASWAMIIETGEPYALTDGNGGYAFYNFAGNYNLTEEHQPGWQPTQPTLGSVYFANFPNGTSYGGAPYLVTTDASVPSVALATVGATTTNASTVQYTATYSEPVFTLSGLNTPAGPTVANFALETSSTITGAFVASVVPAGGNAYTVTVNTGTGDGAITLIANSANLVDAGYNAVTAPIGGPSFIIDKTPPDAPTVQVNDGAVQRSAVRSLTVTFGEIITFVGAGSAAFQLTDTNDVVVPGVTLIVSPIDNTSGVSVVTITFSGAPIVGNSLADGRYRLRTLASQVRDAAGNGLAADAVFNFHRLFGDATGDATVNAADFGQFRNAFGTSTGNPLYRDFLDYNLDGAINAFDFGQFRPRFGVSLP